MKGKISHINPNRGMVAIQTERGDYSIFEILSNDSFEIQDIVEWKNDTALGDTMITNLTQQSRCSVYFQNHWVSASALSIQLRAE